ncbi:MAG TPA: C1 family peptidase [Pseudolabrys sp.]|nr:C1 family peptidase [Pseudolabrys sp.]
MPYTIQKYGWLPDLPDARDHRYAAPMAVLSKLPASVDLRPKCPPVYDQGQLGSCTGNAIAGAIQFGRRKAKQKPDFVPSRLFIYYNERVIEHTVNTDAGAQIRDGIKCAVNQGACNEKTWPYNIAQFTKQPPAAAYQEAKKYQVTSYSRVTQTLSQLKGCLANGYPFVFGFTVYESFESQQVAQTGVMTMPAPKEKVVGGHAVLAVGYDDASQRFIIRNSWGPGWGQKGYFTMPYAYITESNLADDFWTIRLVED